MEAVVSVQFFFLGGGMNSWPSRHHKNYEKEKKENGEGREVNV